MNHSLFLLVFSDVGLISGGRGKYGKVGMGWTELVQGNNACMIIMHNGPSNIFLDDCSLPSLSMAHVGQATEDSYCVYPKLVMIKYLSCPRDGGREDLSLEFEEPRDQEGPRGRHTQQPVRNLKMQGYSDNQHNMMSLSEFSLDSGGWKFIECGGTVDKEWA